MSSKKLHTAFVSCPTELREERRAVLDVLLSFDAFPISTEFFTIQSKDGFRDIEQLIDDSDYFILLLSDRCGTVLNLPDGTNATWTELEARYAFAHAEENGQKIIVLQLPQLTAALAADPATLDAQARRQVAFANSLAGNTVNAVADVAELRTRLATFIEGAKAAGATPGWIRGFSREGVPGLAFGKTYYHVHLSSNLPDYLRIGTIEFSCSTAAPRMIHAEAVNYKAALDAEGRVAPRLGRNKTEWVAEYSYDNGRLLGVYEARKRTSETFGDFSISAGHRRGIHDFRVTSHQQQYVLDGSFADAISRDDLRQSCKSGEVYLFETMDALNQFLACECPDLLDTLKEA